MSWKSEAHRKIPLEKETAYLDSYIRGVYAKTDLKEGQHLMEEDVYLAIPLKKGQISCRELMLGRYGHKMLTSCKKDQQVTVDMLDTPYAHSEELKKQIYARGL